MEGKKTGEAKSYSGYVEMKKHFTLKRVTLDPYGQGTQSSSTILIDENNFEIDNKEYIRFDTTKTQPSYLNDGTLLYENSIPLKVDQAYSTMEHKTIFTNIWTWNQWYYDYEGIGWLRQLEKNNIIKDVKFDTSYIFYSDAFIGNGIYISNVELINNDKKIISFDATYKYKSFGVMQKSFSKRFNYTVGIVND